MVAIGKEVIANFNKQAAVLDPPLPSWDDLIAKWFKDTTGCNFPATVETFLTYTPQSQL